MSVVVIAASRVSSVPSGGVAATTVEAAIDELDSEKVATSALGAASGVATLGSDSKLTDSQVPNATKVPFTPTGTVAATTVAAAIAEVAAEAYGVVAPSAGSGTKVLTSVDGVISWAVALAAIVALASSPWIAVMVESTNTITQGVGVSGTITVEAF